MKAPINIVCAALFFAGGTAAPAATLFPSAGVDIFAATVGVIDIAFIDPAYPGGVFRVVLSGSTEVHRGDPYSYTAGGGQEAIDTEMVSLDMIGSTGPLPVELHLQAGPSAPKSEGRIIDIDPDPDDSYPAESFFDVFFEITIDPDPGTPGELIMHNDDPVRMASLIDSIPPDLGETPYYGIGWVPSGNAGDPDVVVQPLPLPLFNDNDEHIANLTFATHGIPEPDGALPLAVVIGAALLMRGRRLNAGKRARWC